MLKARNKDDNARVEKLLKRGMDLCVNKITDRDELANRERLQASYLKLTQSIRASRNRSDPMAYFPTEIIRIIFDGLPLYSLRWAFLLRLPVIRTRAARLTA